ncbi:MAG: ThiS family protein [Chloroflexi bacterium ADurb.Bin120]|jgi:sulfur carrier protein ThiS|nr:MAG: ThiS family protein [Chloroflexi bacterium ADurb.Bin120]HQP24272.1 MoaD/ThiS family protein [Smithellaceae bacterium]
MKLIINNKEREFPEDITLQEIIQSLEPEINDPKTVLCVLNGTLVNSPFNYVLSEHDIIRVLPIPQGG